MQPNRGWHARSRAHAATVGYDGTVTLPDFCRIEEYFVVWAQTLHLADLQCFVNNISFASCHRPSRPQ